MNYSKELKDALLRRMLPPNNESITKISKEEGISEQTLRNWRDKARRDGYAAPGTDAIPDDWSTQDKFLVVVSTRCLAPGSSYFPESYLTLLILCWIALRIIFIIL